MQYFDIALRKKWIFKQFGGEKLSEKEKECETVGKSDRDREKREGGQTEVAQKCNSGRVSLWLSFFYYCDTMKWEGQTLPIIYMYCTPKKKRVCPPVRVSAHSLGWSDFLNIFWAHDMLYSTILYSRLFTLNCGFFTWCRASKYYWKLLKITPKTNFVP